MEIEATVNGKVVYDMADGNKAMYTFISEDKKTMMTVPSSNPNAFDFGDAVNITIQKKEG